MPLTFEQAKAFCAIRKWFVNEPPHSDTYCPKCKTNHAISVDMPAVGGINRFHSKQEFIDWVKRLIPISI